nr:hypothetical protein [Tanacetum cinerariifolium]
MGINDFLCLFEWTSAEVQEEPYLDRILSLVPLVPRLLLRMKLLRSERPLLQDALYRPTLGVLTNKVLKDPTICKTIVDPFPTLREMFDWVGTSSICLEEAGFRFNNKLSSFDASFVMYKATGKERKKKIKSLTKSVDNLHYEVARLSTALNQATILEAKKDEEILRLNTTPLDFSSFFHAASAEFERGLSMHQTKDEFAVVLKKMTNFMPVRPTTIPALRAVHVSPPTKESTVTPASKSLELSTNVNFTASFVAFEHNREMVNAEVDGSDPKMTNDTVTVKSGHTYVQGISVAVDDAVELVGVGSGRVSSSPNDFVVALSTHEKGNGLDPSSATGEEAAANHSGV